ncbi:type II toxin-antitoxin system Phd/YefM family antitoxin [Pseudomonas sp. MWU13-3659]|uniref:type II toxin-antitoxin system Phd/YefM family antitoxin n=1 Tax=Pseudomonas sp. MWU13-3659 TaxID=2986964 RepID=UPI00207592DC|nr:type II toxin-antitoxin system Phd/YefM family antitoxin [Pseudomonas sp. MWU13-3659]
MNKQLRVLPASVMKRAFKARLGEVIDNEGRRMLILRNTEPAAVLMNARAFQAMTAEIEDLRADQLAAERLPGQGEVETISLETMEARFICPPQAY